MPSPQTVVFSVLRGFAPPALLICIAACGLFVSQEHPPSLEAGENVDVPAAVLYSFGKLSADGTTLRTGDTAPGGSLVSTGRRSLGNLQLRRTGARIVFLMRENAELSLRARRRGSVMDVRPMLRRGEALVKVEGLEPGSERLIVHTPSARIEVRGTRFRLSADPDQDSRTDLAVHEGRVSVRPRMAALEDLSPEILERSREAAKLIGFLDRHETTVNAGEAVAFDSGEAVAAALEQAPELRQTLVKLSKLDVSGDPAVAEQAARKLDASLSENRSRELEQLAAAVAQEGPERRELSAAELDSAAKEYASMVTVESEVLNDPARLNTRLKQIETERRAEQATAREQALQRIARETGGSVRVLLLMNGSSVRGVVQEQGEDYLLITPESRRVYKRAEVKQVLLR